MANGLELDGGTLQGERNRLVHARAKHLDLNLGAGRAA